MSLLLLFTGYRRPVPLIGGPTTGGGYSPDIYPTDGERRHIAKMGVLREDRELVEILTIIARSGVL